MVRYSTTSTSTLSSKTYLHELLPGEDGEILDSASLVPGPGYAKALPSSSVGHSLEEGGEGL